MAASHEESSVGRGSKGRGGGEALLAEVDLLMPATPDLGGSEHAAGPAHIAKRCLASAMGTTARDTRNTRNGTTYKSMLVSIAISLDFRRYAPVPQDSAEVWWPAFSLTA